MEGYLPQLGVASVTKIGSVVTPLVGVGQWALVGGARLSSMQGGYAPFKVVHSRLTLYYSSIVDLRWRRAIHSCHACNFISQDNQIDHHGNSPGIHGNNKRLPCGAIHYGHCTAVVHVSAKTLDGSKTAIITRNGPKQKIRILHPVQQVKQFLRWSFMNVTVFMSDFFSVEYFFFEDGIFGLNGTFSIIHDPGNIQVKIPSHR